jgi:hypothetical protein
MLWITLFITHKSLIYKGFLDIDQKLYKLYINYRISMFYINLYIIMQWHLKSRQQSY